MSADSQNSFEKNKTHYEENYAAVRSGPLITFCQNIDNSLADATKTDTSWVGIYYGNFMKRLRNTYILEIGCGNGLNALVMATLGAARVIAVDIAAPKQQIIEAVDALELSDRFELRIGDFSEMKFDIKFDWIVGKAFLHHLTHQQEDIYLAKIATLLKNDGEARFFEPAVNNMLLDTIRWHVLVPGRPSKFQTKRYAAWKAIDPHPDRDNSSKHYLEAGHRYFEDVDIIPLAASSGSIVSYLTTASKEYSEDFRIDLNGYSLCRCK